MNTNIKSLFFAFVFFIFQQSVNLSVKANRTKALFHFSPPPAVTSRVFLLLFLCFLNSAITSP